MRPSARAGAPLVALQPPALGPAEEPPEASWGALVEVTGGVGVGVGELGGVGVVGPVSGGPEGGVIAGGITSSSVSPRTIPSWYSTPSCAMDALRYSPSFR